MLNNFTFEVGFTPLIVSTILRLFAAGYFLRVIWLAYKETGVKNGIAKLRKQLLASALILFLINTIGMSLLIARSVVDSHWYRVSTDSLAVFNSFGFFIVAYIKHEIYTQQYTPENKELHAHMARIETRTNKRHAKERKQKREKRGKK